MAEQTQTVRYFADRIRKKLSISRRSRISPLPCLERSPLLSPLLFHERSPLMSPFRGDHICFSPYSVNDGKDIHCSAPLESVYDFSDTIKSLEVIDKAKPVGFDSIEVIECTQPCTAQDLDTVVDVIIKSVPEIPVPEDSWTIVQYDDILPRQTNCTNRTRSLCQDGWTFVPTQTLNRYPRVKMKAGTIKS